MSVSNEINRLINAKAAIKQSIVNKGVDVSDSALLDEYPALIDSIEVGGGGVEGEPPYKMWWNAITNNDTDYKYLFRDYNGTTLDVSNLDTSNVKDMSYMFYGCSSLTQLDVSNFNTSNVTTMASTFYDCTNLTSLDVSNWDTSNVTVMQSMFQNCNNLTSLDLSNWDTSNVTGMQYMFYYCKLTSLDCSNWDVSKCTGSSSINSMLGSSSFNSCTALVDFKAPKNISAPMNVQYCTALSHDSLMSIINNLITTTSTKTLTLGATNLAKLTADEIAIATNKGWTVK